MSDAVACRSFRVAEADLGVAQAGPGAAEGDTAVPPSTGRLSDAQLAERVADGDGSAFDELVGRHMGKAFGAAFRLLGQKEDAEDLVQEAFLAALEKIDSFDTGRDFSPWFYRILVNRCLNARKARSRRQTVELPGETRSPGPSPLREAERSELRYHLARALEDLPERQQTIVKLFDLEGFTSPEIAEILEISDGTVRWHLHQARRALREALEPFARRQA